MQIENFDVLIIGAGPSGTVAAALLRKQGRSVLILEKEIFPRFSIGESLLPQSMQYLEEAGMLQDVVEAGFQYKNGASFVRGEKSSEFDFRDKFSEGWGTTYQVQRATFDHVLAKAAERQGAEIRWQHEVVSVDVKRPQPLVTARSETGVMYQVEARYVLDASGFARVLPRLLQLEAPSNFPSRTAIFTHIEDHIPPGIFDRNKTRITVHPKYEDVWFWTIPFSDGKCSIGVVAKSEFLEKYKGSHLERLQMMVAEEPTLTKLFKNAAWNLPARSIAGYSANVTTLWGPGFALLGNAGEFLDPIFSSGVTIALRSASLASACIARDFANEKVDWQIDYAEALSFGVNTFRVFVDAWYTGAFQKVIFHKSSATEIRGMISSILAGYAWDKKNPYSTDSKHRLNILVELCSA